MQLSAFRVDFWPLGPKIAVPGGSFVVPNSLYFLDCFGDWTTNTVCFFARPNHEAAFSLHGQRPTVNSNRIDNSTFDSVGFRCRRRRRL